MSELTPREIVYLNGGKSVIGYFVESLKEVEIEDLLGRETVHLDNKNINSLIKNILTKI